MAVAVVNIPKRVQAVEPIMTIVELYRITWERTWEHFPTGQLLLFKVENYWLPIEGEIRVILVEGGTSGLPVHGNTVEQINDGAQSNKTNAVRKKDGPEGRL